MNVPLYVISAFDSKQTLHY